MKISTATTSFDDLLRVYKKDQKGGFWKKTVQFQKPKDFAWYIFQEFGHPVEIAVICPDRCQGLH